MEASMCDYSLHSVKTRAAQLEDRLIVYNFGTGTRGFAEPYAGGASLTAGCATALCVKPGTEIAFDEPIRYIAPSYLTVSEGRAKYCVAIFRQVDKDRERTHHDALELPDGQIVMLTNLYEGQTGKILQLPAEPKTVEEAKEQERVAWAG
jgi:hypothetical protein